MRKLILILIILSSVGLNAQSLKRYVSGSAGGTVSSQSHKIRGTLSQLAIGRNSFGLRKHSAGFWYKAAKEIDEPGGGTTISLPTVDAKVGEEVSIPLMLVQSSNFKLSGARTFEAKIKFNSTVLSTIGQTPDCDEIRNGFCTISVTGTMEDSVGILAELDFKVKLGNAEATDLEIVSFEWKETINLKIVKKHGRLNVIDVCRENGEIRLVETGVPAEIVNAYPNPASETVTIDVSMGEKGLTEIILVDNDGKHFKTIYSDLAEIGRKDIVVDLMMIPSGSYFIVMRTPNEIFSKRLLISK